MRIKKFNEEEFILEEFHPDDRATLIKYGTDIRKYISTFDVSIINSVGTIKLDGMIKFTTQGPETMATILAYVTGMYDGLNYKK